MRINELILESSEVDEGLGAALGKGIGAVGRGIGAVASVPQGFGRAIKRGYQKGLDVIGGPSGGTSEPTAGSTSSIGASTPAQPKGFSQGFKQGFSGTRGSTTPTTVAPSQTSAASAAPTNPMSDKKFVGSLQALKGGDVEKVRQVLQARAAVAESLEEAINLSGAQQALQNWLASKGLAYDAASIKAGLAQMPADLKQIAQQTYQGLIKKPAVAAGKAIAKAPGALGTVAGKVGAAGTAFKQAYQTARGSYMTIQDLQHMIAIMNPKDAAEALQFFNSIHPPQGTSVDVGQPNLKVVDGGQAPAGTAQSLGSRGIPGLGESSVFRSKFLGMDI